MLRGVGLGSESLLNCRLNMLLSSFLTHMLLCVNDHSVQLCTKQLMLLQTLSPFSHLGTYVASASTHLISSLQASHTKESVDRDMERANSLAG